MERRVLIAIILSMAVFYVYEAYFLPPQPDQPAAQTPSKPGPGSAPAAGKATVTAAPAVPPAETLLAEPDERQITVETNDVEAVLTNRGGRLLHWRLKRYTDDKGQPVDLVPSALPADQPSPFSLRTDDAPITERLNNAFYRVTGDQAGRVDATRSPATLAFEYQDAAGLRARKEFSFEPNNFTVTFSATVTNGDRAINPTVAWGPGLGDLGAVSGGGSFFTGNYVQPPQAIYHQDGKAQRVTASKVGDQPVHEGQFRFAGIDDHYFLAAAVNPGTARMEYHALTLPGADGTQRQLITQTFRFPQPPQGVKFFIGPKQFDTLRAVDGELVRSINFGIFGFIAVPLLNWLKWLNSYIGNWGWSIIALTVLINLVLFPLRHKSVVAMRKMQAIQPQVKAIQDRYANLSMTDPAKQKMNTEIMNLYREKGVNPAGGCVPMLLQFPLLLAMYSVLSQAIELRGADFALWIHDLSLHDPYFVTPLLMGVTMFVQQRMTPTTADPAQQRVMMIMPVFMTAIFLRLASGLAIYYLVGNLFAIGQQYVTSRLIGPPPVQAPRPPAERKIKSAGAGKSAGADKK